jgi:hypothetical protein
MSLTRPSWVTNTIQSLANRVQGQGTALKQNFDKLASDTKTYTTNLCDEIEAQFTSKSEITNNRKLSSTGDFTGTWNGLAPTASDPGLAATVNAHLASKSHFISIKNPPLAPMVAAKGDWVGDASTATDDTVAINAILDYAETVGGVVVAPTSSGDYKITDTVFVGSNTTLLFEGKSYFKLASYTSVGTMIFNKPGATDITIINPLLDGNNNAEAGENGISCGDCGIMRVYGGHIKNCASNLAPPKSGGKAFQVEAYEVKNFFADGTFIENCGKALSSVRDMAHAGKVTARFNNIYAKDCGQFSIFTQTNGIDIYGLEHDVMVTNFIVENCGSIDGVFVFSRTHNCHFINGRIINASTVDSIIRGRHSRCTFDNIDILGSCGAVIDLNPSYFGLSTDASQENKYDFKVFGTYDYLLKSDTTGITYTNNALLGSEINALLINDAAIGLVENHSASQTTIMNIRNANGKRIANSTTNVYFLTNTFALAPKLKMEYHTLENYNMGVNTKILKSDAALNVSAAGLTRPVRFWGPAETYNLRITPNIVTVIDAVDNAEVISDLAIDGKTIDVRTNGTAALQIRSTTTSPGADNAQSLGLDIYRWSVVYAATGTINTSDKNLKTMIETIPQNICDAALELSIVKFKFKEAADKKGNSARWHYGVIAQDAMQVFEKHGVDLETFGAICVNKFYDENGNEVAKVIDNVELNEIWQVRYDELQMIILEAFKRKMLS